MKDFNEHECPYCQKKFIEEVVMKPETLEIETRILPSENIHRVVKPKMFTLGEYEDQKPYFESAKKMNPEGQ